VDSKATPWCGWPSGTGCEVVRREMLKSLEMGSPPGLGLAKGGERSPSSFRSES